MYMHRFNRLCAITLNVLYKTVLFGTRVSEQGRKGRDVR